MSVFFKGNSIYAFEDKMEEFYTFEPLDDDYSTMEQVSLAESVWDIYDFCVVPTITGVLPSIFTLLLWGFIYKISSLSESIPKWLIHILSCVCGIALLFTNIGWSVANSIILGCSTFIFLIVGPYHYKGYILSVSCFCYLVMSELFMYPVAWQQIRGIQMIITMKAISVAFDVDREAIKLPSIISYMGYIFCVANIYFGPWIPYKEYDRLSEFKTLNAKLILKLLWILSLSLFFLTMCNCWGYLLIPDDSWKWLVVFRDAMLFRSSHYFVSYLSEASVLIVGFGYDKENGSWSYPVVNVLSMEYPRSLVMVVINWNIPMHKWLKYYVFRQCQHLGSFWAIFFTYLASAALHGFSAALAIILISLGFYTYVEYVLRGKISDIFNVCTRANECKQNCRHIYKKYHPLTVIINLLFTFVTVIHLAYLGVVFEQIALMKTENLIEHIFTVWSDLGFLSHAITAVLYCVCFLI